MTTNLRPETAHVGDELVDVHAICGCGRRNINVKLYASAVVAMQQIGFAGERKVGTWWCWRCRRVTILTARALHIAAA